MNRIARGSVEMGVVQQPVDGRRQKGFQHQFLTPN